MVDEQFRIDVILDPAKSKPGIDRAQKDIERIEKEAADLRGALIEALSVRDAGTTRALENVNQTLLRSERLAENTQRAVFEIGEQVDSSGIREADRALGDAKDSADELGDSVAGIFAGISIGVLANQFREFTDELTSVRNRLRLVTEGEEELGDVTTELFNIARATRSEFGATATLFTRLALRSDELGRSQAELLQFTESLNQAIILSGATSVEASAGLIQLSQALARGVLRGDEFRSVSEQLPIVLDTIKREAGLTNAELQELAVQGGITADLILDSFARASGQIAADFETTSVTIGQALVNLENSFAQMLDRFEQFTKQVTDGHTSSNLLAEGIGVASENLGTLSLVAAAAGVAIGSKLLPQLGQFLGVTQRLPLSLGAVTIAGAAFVALSEAIRVEYDAAAQTLRDVEDSAEFIPGIAAQITARQRELNQLNRQIEAQARRGVEASEGQIRQIERLEAAIRGAREAQQEGARSTQELNRRIREQEEGIRSLVDQLNKERDALALSSAEREVQEEVEKRLAELKKQGIDLDEERIAEVRSLVEHLIEENRVVDRQAKLLEQIRGPAEEYQAILSDLEALLKSNIITQDEFNRAVAEFVPPDFQPPDFTAPEVGPARQDDPFEGFVESLQRQNDQLAIRASFEGEEERFLLLKERIEERIGELNEEQIERVRQLATTQQELTDLTRERAQAEREAEQARRDQEREAEQEQRAIEAIATRIDLEGRLAEERRRAQAAFAQGLITETQLEQELDRIRDVGAQEEARRNQDEIDALIRQIELTDSLAEKERLLGEARASGTIDDKMFDQLRLEALEASTDIEAGFERAFIKIGQQADDFASKAEQAVNAFANTAADALADFATTGKFEFEEFANSVIQSITRIATEALVQQAIKLIADLASSIGGGGGGGGANLSGAVSRQAGGPVRIGQPAIVGERQPELFVPDRSGTILPSVEAASGGARQEPPRIAIVNVTDPKELAGAINSGELDQAIINRINRNKRRVRGALR